MYEETLKYPRRDPKRLGGDEVVVGIGLSPAISVLEFWGWSASDLLSNATRGRFAEFLVAKALGISTAGVRDEWAIFDLQLPDGSGIEVKSAAYLQSWGHKELSKIKFSVRRSRAWDATTNEMAAEAGRSAKAYVFALLKHQDKATVDPLNLDQWEFYVLPTWAIDERKRSQHSITLASLEAEAGPAESFGGLAGRVRAALVSRTAPGSAVEESPPDASP